MRPHNNFVVKIAVLTVIALLGLSLTSFAQAPPPGRINYQGVLRDASGNPLNGLQTMTFRFYDAPTGTVTLLWEEIYDPTVYTPQVTVTNGLFTVALGDAADHRHAGTETAFTNVFSKHTNVYLAVQVGSDPEMTPRIKVVSAPYAENSEFLDGHDSSYFLDTSSTDQTKAGKLTLNGTTGFGLDASGPAASAYFHNSNSSGMAYPGYSDYGIMAYGNDAGGYFEDADNSGYAYVGFGDYGIQARGNTAGGYFSDSYSTARAYVGYDSEGIDAWGNIGGGYFSNSASGHAYLGHKNDGIDAYGNTVAGYFEDTDSSGKAWAAYGDYGIKSSGNTAGGHFQDANNSGYAYVGYSDYGIRAFGNTMGGYFKDGNSSGFARLGYGDDGITAYGNEKGGLLEDYDSSGYAYVGYSTYKIFGSGTVSFVQNHPYGKDKVIVYACPEGDEVATYTRGTARLVNGEAHVKLGETFKWVTNPDIGLTVHLTPEGDCNGLFVKSKSTSELVVRELSGGQSNTTFDYIVYGLRIGFEESSIVQEKQQESYIPSFKDHRERYAKYPELRAFNSLERFTAMESSVRGIKASSIDLSRTRALKEAIHEYDPATDPPVEKLFGNGREEPGSEGAAPESHPHSLTPQPIRTPASSTRDVGSWKTPNAGQSLAPAEPVIKGESLPVADSVMAGDVLVMVANNGEALYPCATTADPMVAGIAVTDARDGYAFVVGYGFTVVKADATLHPIAKGDLLVASVLPGHAMRADNPMQGTVVGKALEPLASGTGLIRVLVMMR